jgi:heme O synthase-like polyprenyltransferase
VLSTFGLYISALVDGYVLVSALFLGICFLYTCHRGFYQDILYHWAKRAFKASLLYQSALFFMLIYAALVSNA